MVLVGVGVCLFPPPRRPSGRLTRFAAELQICLARQVKCPLFISFSMFHEKVVYYPTDTGGGILGLVGVRNSRWRGASADGFGGVAVRRSSSDVNCFLAAPVLDLRSGFG
jgi:hypothetical protein